MLEGLYEALVPVMFFLILGILYIFVEAWTRNWRIVCQMSRRSAKAKKVRGVRTTQVKRSVQR